MARIIIGIHGLGNKPDKPTLKKWWRMSMIEGLKSIGKEDTSISKFEMVYWADVMYEKPLDKSVKNPESPFLLEERYTKAPSDFQVEDHSLRMSIIDFIGKQLNDIFLNEDFSLNYSFITDYIVSKYFRELEVYYRDDCEENIQECKTKDKIKSRLVNALEKYKNDEIMLVCHSMGTIIAYDVLTFLAPQIKVHSLVTMGSPLGLPVIISKIAAEHKRRMEKEIKMVTPPGVYINWFNFSDILDKIAFNFKLADDFTENDHGVKPVDFQVVNDYHINGVHNPHKSFGYLRTKEFAKVLYEFITRDKPL